MDIPLDITRINEKLETKFGKMYSHFPRYRVVWSDSQIEHRKTIYKNGIFLTDARVEQVPKYSYLKRQWVLERWTENTNDEIISVSGYTYEPVWAFKEGQRPVWKAVLFVAQAAETGVGEKMTPKDFERDNEAAFKREVGEFEEMLNEQGPDYGNQTDAFVAPVFMDSKKQRMKDNG